MNNDWYTIAILLSSVHAGEVSDKNNESPIVSLQTALGAIRDNYKEIIEGKVLKERIKPIRHKTAACLPLIRLEM